MQCVEEDSFLFRQNIPGVDSCVWLFLLDKFVHAHQVVDESRIVGSGLLAFWG
jgi:hypothetical protein